MLDGGSNQLGNGCWWDIWYMNCGSSVFVLKEIFDDVYIYIHLWMEYFMKLLKNYLITNLICFSLTGGWGSGGPLFESTFIFQPKSFLFLLFSTQNIPKLCPFVCPFVPVPLHTLRGLKHESSLVKLCPVMPHHFFRTGFSLSFWKTQWSVNIVGKKELKLLLWLLLSPFMFIYVHIFS